MRAPPRLGVLHASPSRLAALKQGGVVGAAVKVRKSPAARRRESQINFGGMHKIDKGLQQPLNSRFWWWKYEESTLFRSIGYCGLHVCDNDQRREMIRVSSLLSLLVVAMCAVRIEGVGDSERVLKAANWAKGRSINSTSSHTEIYVT